jgi:hypothetical protein
MKELPIGMQDFKQIIDDGYTYVDKTRYFYELLKHGKNYFLSRPRRFGKTLTCSTLYYLFKGEKELFKDTWIYDKWDFKPYPVISISMTMIEAKNPDTITQDLKTMLLRIYREYGLEPRVDGYKALFSDLIDQLSAHGQVVVLIDEYDRPMIEHISEPEAARAIRAVMREFYLVVKGMESRLKFVLFTGLTKITKAGIFSTLNHLDELTTQPKFGAMLGYTQEELEAYFDGYLQAGASKLGVSREELVARVRDYYDGFSFDGEHFVYNPFSMLKFFSEYRFKNYWIQSGLSSSLAEYIKTHQIKPEDYLNSYMPEEMLTSYEIEQAPPQSFLAQSGYLTFQEDDPERGYRLDYPNREVRNSMSELILLGSYNIDGIESSALRDRVIVALRERKFEPVFDAMKATLANVPAKLYDNDKKKDYAEKEAYYHAVILTLLWACGLHVHAEEYTSRSMSDLVLDYHGDIWVIELKKASTTVSLQQIKDKGYAEKYAAAPFLALVGIEIDIEQKNLKTFEMEIQYYKKNTNRKGREGRKEEKKT